MVAPNVTAPSLVKLALDWAAVWHHDQTRKYPKATAPAEVPSPDDARGVPYMSHVAGVAAILSRHGFSETVVAAGALHDVLEDCGVTYDALAARFGAPVADLVRHVSEADKSLPWEERKRQYVEHFAAAPWEAQAISLADKTDNLESIVVARSLGDPWALFKRGRDVQLARFAELLERARALAPHPLIDELARALARAERI